jgi:DNA polymerase-4
MKIFSLVDMDAFFTSVEEAVDPSLRFKPVVVGTRVVACANYIARKYGISSAMPTFKAKELCRELIVLSGNHKIYKNVSKKIKNFLGQFSPYVYQASIDEFYLDLTSICKNFEEAEVLSYEISKSLYNKFHITASIGVAPTLITSKIASEINKPNGMEVVYPQDMEDFILSTKVESFPGIGKSTLKKLLQLSIHYARDFDSSSISSLKRSFTNNQIYYLKLLLSGDDRASFVQRESKNKSISRSTSFEEPIKSEKEVLNLLMYFLEKMLRSLRDNDLLTNTIEISLRKTDYTWKSKRKSLKIGTRDRLITKWPRISS